MPSSPTHRFFVKTQIQFMVKAKLKMSHSPEPIDAADALAIALCHDHQFRMADL